MTWTEQEQREWDAELNGRAKVEEPMPFGPEWHIEGIADIGRAVRRVQAGLAGKDEAALKQWIAKRAKDMGVEKLVPAGWAKAQ